MANFHIEEVQLELSYGIIAAKWWGSKQRRPILMVHGWQDNAGSFDALLPMLPSNYSYLAIDLPGHGYSSHLPKGCYYHTVDLVPILEEIRLKYKWKRLSLIAHSMGAIISFFYASLFPDKVDFVCALDTLKMQHYCPQFTERIYTYRTQKLIALNQVLMEKSPDYTYDEVVQRVYEGSMMSLDSDKAKYMIERGTKRSQYDPNKFNFTRDIRVKYMQPFYVEQQVCLKYIKRIRAAYLFIRSDDRTFSEPEKNIHEAVDTFRRCNKHFELLRVKGTHHVHINSPEFMAEKIADFVRKHHIQEEATYKSKL